MIQRDLQTNAREVLVGLGPKDNMHGMPLSNY